MNDIIHRDFDKSQKYWELAIIQASGLGLPGMLIGSYIAKQVGTAEAISSLVIANLILWIISLAIVEMSWGSRSNGIQNVGVLLGNSGKFLAAGMLSLAFIGWYSMQISSHSDAIICFIDQDCNQELNYKSLIGFLFGLIAAGFSIGGISIIKWLSKIVFPMILFFLLWVLFFTPLNYSIDFSGFLRPSLFGILQGMLVTLPGVVNISTFFRHSRSKSDSVLGLSLMTPLIIFFQCSFCFFQYTDSYSWIDSLNLIGNSYFTEFFILFVTASYLMINIMNVYLASTVIELIIPNFTGGKEYFLIGVLGTFCFIFFQNGEGVEFVENFSTNSIGILGLVLIVSFLINSFLKEGERRPSESLRMFVWVISSILSCFLLWSDPTDNITPLLYGIFSCIIFFLLIFFFDELVWAYKSMKKNKNK